VPSIIRRQFARLAGLLELGDSEFIKIREELESYEKSISYQINEAPQSVSLDKVTLVDFLKTEQLVLELDSTIAKELGRKLIANEYDINGDIEKLQFFNIHTVAELKDALTKFKGHIEKLAHKWGKQRDESDGIESLKNGISIFYLCHVLAGATQDLAKASQYYLLFRIGSQGEQMIAEELIDFMREGL
jgi:hypothetical protein